MIVTIDSFGDRLASRDIQTIITQSQFRKAHTMSLSSKLFVTMLIGAIFAPIAASANPVANGSTAAAVSIKFRHGGTSGGFSISPGANANGGGTGVSELSAAVATGETDAKAESSSSRHGTAATASGWSAPVNFSYAVINDRAVDKYTAEYSSHSKSEQAAALHFTAGKQDIESSAQESSDVRIAKLSASKKSGINSELVKADNSSQQSGSSSTANVQSSSKTGATAANHTTQKQGSESIQTSGTTVYSYSGPSAGLRYLPEAK